MIKYTLFHIKTKTVYLCNKTVKRRKKFKMTITNEITLILTSRQIKFIINNSLEHTKSHITNIPKQFQKRNNG